MKTSDIIELLNLFNPLPTQQIAQMPYKIMFKRIGNRKNLPTSKEVAKLIASAKALNICRGILVREKLLEEAKKLLTRAFPSQIILRRSDGISTTNIRTLKEGRTDFWTTVAITVDSTAAVGFRVAPDGRAEINFDRFGDEFDKDFFRFLREHHMTTPYQMNGCRYMARSCCMVDLDDRTYRRNAMRFAREVMEIYLELAALVEKYQQKNAQSDL